MSTDDQYKVCFSREEDRHDYGDGSVVQRDMLRCRPICNRLISVRLRAAPFKITIIQVYALTSEHNNNAVDKLHQQLQETIDQTPK